METLERFMNERVLSIKSELRSNPGKWAGIAAGAGFTLGLIGRRLRHRARRNLPDLIIIEAR